MSYKVIKTPIQPNLCSWTLSLPVHRIVSFLGHNPQSKYWPDLPAAMQDLYRNKQRETDQKRIEALEEYITTRLIGGSAFAAFPPISVIQFQPVDEKEQVREVLGGLFLDESRRPVTRMLSDGLARYTAVANVRSKLVEKSDIDVESFDDQFEFTVTLYTPVTSPFTSDEAGQLFVDFNMYAWKVSTGKAVSADLLNPYVICAREVGGPGKIIKRYGGLKAGGSGRLGSKDTQFTTELIMSKFVKIAIEGRRAVGQGFSKSVGVANVRGKDPKELATRIDSFFSAMLDAFGHDRFVDRTQIFRTSHSLEAIAVIAHAALFDGRTTVDQATRGLASIDWTWNNEEFRRNLGKQNSKGKWVLNPGGQTQKWLLDYLMPYCVYKDAA